MTSGAKYSGVPQNDLALELSEIFSLLKPKSVIFIYPSRLIRTFSGFKLYNIKLINIYIYYLLSIDYIIFMKMVYS